MFEKVPHVIAVGDDFFAYGFVGDRVKSLAIFLPFLWSANRLRTLLILQRLKFSGKRPVLLGLGFLYLLREVAGFHGGVRFQFTLRIESAGERIGHRDDGQLMVREHEHRDQKFLGSYQLFGPAPALRAALEGARQLSEMKNAQVSFRMPSAVMRER